MGISKRDRDDYEQGRKDNKKGVFERTFNDVTVKHPDTAAYYKGRSGKQLDDKKGKA
jgi:hypothetical protein